MGRKVLALQTVQASNGFPQSFYYVLGGGMPTTTNRTKWPVKGGAVSVQPGWFQGHSKALFYINMGLGTTPPNMSLPMMPVFQIIGPTNEPYPGTFCIPQVPLPAGVSVNVGDHATIQVIEASQSGAALYNVCWVFLFLVFFFSRTRVLILWILQCVDIEFAEPEDVDEVTRDNCFNSSDISFNTIFTTSSLSGATRPLRITKQSVLSAVPLIVIGLFGFVI